MSTTVPQRLVSLTSALGAHGIDAFLAWHPVTMGYLHNFHEGAIERFLALCLHKDGRSAIICPSLSATQAARAGMVDIRSWRDGEDPLVLFGQLAEEWGLKSAIIAVDDEMPAHMLLAMQMVLPAALFRTGGEILGSLQFSPAFDPNFDFFNPNYEKTFDYLNEAPTVAAGNNYVAIYFEDKKQLSVFRFTEGQ